MYHIYSHDECTPHFSNQKVCFSFPHIMMTPWICCHEHRLRLNTERHINCAAHSMAFEISRAANLIGHFRMFPSASYCRLWKASIPPCVGLPPQWLHVFIVSSIGLFLIFTRVNWSGCLHLSRAARGQYATYTVCFKLKSVKYPLKNCSCASRRHFSIDEVCVRYWTQQHEKLFERTIWSGVQPNMRHTTMKDTQDMHSNERGECHTTVTRPLSRSSLLRIEILDRDRLPLAHCTEEPLVTEEFDLDQKCTM